MLHDWRTVKGEVAVRVSRPRDDIGDAHQLQRDGEYLGFAFQIVRRTSGTTRTLGALDAAPGGRAGRHGLL